MNTPSTPLPLRRISQAQAQVARHLAGVPWMTFTVAQHNCRLTLAALRRNPADTPLRWFDTALGPIGLGAAQSVLGACSSSPVFVDSEDAWLWPLYNAGLSQELAAQLGSLQPLAEPAQPTSDWVHCELTVEREQGRIDSVLAMAASTLAHWLEQPTWNAHPPRDHSGLKLAFALRLGRLSLTRKALATLRPGDVVIPQEPDFDTDGNGVLVIGPRRLHARVCQQPKRLRLVVEHIEEWTVTDREEAQTPFDEYAEAWEDDDAYANDDTLDAEPEGYDDQEDNEDAYADVQWDEQATPEPQSAPPEPSAESPEQAFADLALPLTLRCGQLQLTLGELAALQPGAILEVPGVTPGLAGLYYGERRLAHGELVDVQGRLGLQITQLDERG